MSKIKYTQSAIVTLSSYETISIDFVCNSFGKKYHSKIEYVFRLFLCSKFLKVRIHMSLIPASILHPLQSIELNGFSVSDKLNERMLP